MIEHTSVDSATVFRESDEFVDTGYRRVTLWAFAAFFTGLASVLAFVSPLLWILPPAAIGFGLVALRVIRAQEDVLGGRKLALFGIVLATVFLSWAVTTHYVHSQMVYALAQVNANRWFELVKAGELREAHQLRRNYMDRAGPDQSLAEFYGMIDQQQVLDSFLQDPLIEKISQLGPDAKLTFLAGSYFTRETATIDVVGLRYRLESATGEEPPVIVEIELTREYFSGTHESHWTVRRVDFAPRAT